MTWQHKRTTTIIDVIAIGTFATLAFAFLAFVLAVGGASVAAVHRTMEIALGVAMLITLTAGLLAGAGVAR